MSKYEEAVNKAIKDATTDDKGKVTYPDDTPDEIVYMANLEKRRRDTQSALTKEQESGVKLAAENTKMASAWEAEVSKVLTATQREELEELKHTDPEAWREKLNEHETANASKFKEKRDKIKTEASEESELEQRTRLLTEYNEANPDHQITDDVIDNDLPPRISKKLASGEATFSEFLVDAKDYLGTPKKVGSVASDAPSATNLDDGGGSDTPPDTAVEAEAAESYKNEIY